MRRLVEEKNLEVIRLAFPDQHGILRGETIIASEAIASLGERLLHHHPPCSPRTPRIARCFRCSPRAVGFGMKEMEGAARRADGRRSRHVPRACHGRRPTGWGAVRSLFWPTGRPVPFATRGLLSQGARRARKPRPTISSPGSRSNFHIFKLDDPHMRPRGCRPAGHAAVGEAC